MRGFQLLVLGTAVTDVTAVALMMGRLQITCGFWEFALLGWAFFFALFMFLVMTLLSLIYLLLEFKTNIRRATVPLAVNLIAFLIATFIPLERTSIDLRFLINFNDFKNVVALVENGVLKPDPPRGFGYTGRLILLPKNYQHLSNCGGAVMVDQSGGVNRVYFFTYQDIFFSSAGYMYRSSGQPEQQDFDLPYGGWFCDRLDQEHWYFCQRTD